MAARGRRLGDHRAAGRWGGDGFVFYDGYWGPHVGFYGGINYGFGYFGVGFEGGRWDNGHFFCNRSVNNVNMNEIHNVYNTPVTNHNESHVSYNGGNGGITARPTAAEPGSEARGARNRGAYSAQYSPVPGVGYIVWGCWELNREFRLTRFSLSSR